jgi:hypothetical protein
VDSTELMPVHEIVRRLVAIRAATPPNGAWLKKTTPVYQHLSIRDIARFAGFDKTILYKVANGVPPKPSVQKQLTWFFRIWDKGYLVKERIDGKGVLVYRDPQSDPPARTGPPAAAAAQSAARPSAPPKVMDLKVEIGPNGIKLRM